MARRFRASVRRGKRKGRHRSGRRWHQPQIVFCSAISDPKDSDPREQQPAEPPSKVPGGDGGNSKGESDTVVDTALFERQQETRSDVVMARQAIRNRWETPKPLSQLVLQKALTLAAGLPWQKPDGEVRQEEQSPSQIIAAGKLALDIERQNQGQEHHIDRMEYYERALQMRSKVGDYKPPPGAGLKVETEGKSTVTVYLPNNGREEPDDILRPEDLLLDHE